jgi:hypothetical protein
MGRPRFAERVALGWHVQRHHPPPAAEPLVDVDGPDARDEDRRLCPRPPQDASEAGHDGRADIPVDGDLGQRGSAERATDDLAVPGRGQPQQFLVTVGEMIIFVAGDHPHRTADVLPVAGIFAQGLHLFRGPLLRDPAVRQVDHYVGLSQLLPAAQPAVC